MDSYQPIFDAVRSRISGGDVGQAVESVLRECFGSAHHVMQGVANEYASAAIEQQRPSVIFRPVLLVDGDQWCARYGADLQNGVAGFGDSPDKAMRDFDAQWLKPLAAQGDKP